MAEASGAYQFSELALEQASFPTTILGFSPYDRSKAAQFRPGNGGIGADGTVWVYGKATAAIALTPVAPPAYGLPMAAVTPVTPADCAFTAATGTIGAGATHKAYAAFAVDEYGWVKQTAELY
jgi:hypothetical protein